MALTLVLHTWDQRQRAHFHLHGLIASGALSADGSRWIAGGRRFLFSVRGLSKMFRGNHRIVSCEKGEVTFRYRDRADGDRVKLERLPAEEFIGRFLQHVLPSGFFRVRHYGLLANCVKKELLVRCRQLMGAQPRRPADDAPRTAAQWMQHLLGLDITCCPCCGVQLEREPLPLPSTVDDPTYVPEPYPEFEAWNTS